VELKQDFSDEQVYRAGPAGRLWKTRRLFSGSWRGGKPQSAARIGSIAIHPGE
jgi:hypothetical protein